MPCAGVQDAKEAGKSASAIFCPLWELNSDSKESNKVGNSLKRKKGSDAGKGKKE